MAYWLVKSEPESFSYDDLVAAGTEHWDGIRSYQARNYLREMKVGDWAIFYHSNAKPAGAAGDVIAAAGADVTGNVMSEILAGTGGINIKTPGQLGNAEVTVPGRLPGSKQALSHVLRNARHIVAAGGYPASEAEHAAGRTLPITVVEAFRGR